MFDRIRTALTDETPADRARHEETRKWLKTRLESRVQELENEISEFDRSQDPTTNLFIETRASAARWREQRVSALEYVRHELRNLS